jgi:hypothetical protein
MIFRRVLSKREYKLRQGTRAAWLDINAACFSVCRINQAVLGDFCPTCTAHPGLLNPPVQKRKSVKKNNCPLGLAPILSGCASTPLSVRGGGDPLSYWLQLLMGWRVQWPLAPTKEASELPSYIAGNRSWLYSSSPVRKIILYSYRHAAVCEKEKKFLAVRRVSA